MENGRKSVSIELKKDTKYETQVIEDHQNKKSLTDSVQYGLFIILERINEKWRYCNEENPLPSDLTEKQYEDFLEFHPQIIDFVNSIGSSLLDEQTDTDKKLTEAIQNASIIEKYLALRDQLNIMIGRQKADRIFSQFDPQVLCCDKIRIGNRFKNQKAGRENTQNFAEQSSVTSRSTAPWVQPIRLPSKGVCKHRFPEFTQEENFVKIGTKISVGGNASGYSALEKIFQPDTKAFSESEYSKKYLIKHGEPVDLIEEFNNNATRYQNDTYKIQLYNRRESNEFHVENEYMIIEMIKVLDETKYYEIQKIKPANDKNPYLIAIKLLQNVDSLGGLLSETGLKTQKANSKSFIESNIRLFLLGVGGDVNNLGNSLIDKNGLIYSIDHTALLGNDHLRRVERLAEALRIKDFQEVKSILLEPLNQEAKYRDFNLGDKYRQRLIECINEISGEELLEILQKYTTPDKISVIKEIWDHHYAETGRYQRDPNGILINYNIPAGFEILSQVLHPVNQRITTSNDIFDIFDNSIQGPAFA